jgi:hypothetical protein
MSACGGQAVESAAEVANRLLEAGVDCSQAESLQPLPPETSRAFCSDPDHPVILSISVFPTEDEARLRYRALCLDPRDPLHDHVIVGSNWYAWMAGDDEVAARAAEVLEAELDPPCT